jgi:hypothetical protein
MIHFNVIFRSLPNGLLPSGFLTRTFYVFFVSSIFTTYPAHLIPLDVIIMIIFGEEYRYRPTTWCMSDHYEWLVMVMTEVLATHHAKNIYLMFLFWIAVQVVQ